MMDHTIPTMGNRLSRWLGRSVLKLLRWQVVGKLPSQSKLVIVVAPHTSNWDFVIAMAAVLAHGVKLSYLMKKEAFFFPFKNLFMSLGGIPIDRAKGGGLVEQAAAQFKQQDKLWLAITPEGTRSQVGEYKSGFLRIAQAAKVPVFIIAWHYPEKKLILDCEWPLTGDKEHDAAAIRTYINRHYIGKHPAKQ